MAETPDPPPKNLSQGQLINSMFGSGSRHENVSGSKTRVDRDDTQVVFTYHDINQSKQSTLLAAEPKQSKHKNGAESLLPLGEHMFHSKNSALSTSHPQGGGLTKEALNAAHCRMFKEADSHKHSSGRKDIADNLSVSSNSSNARRRKEAKEKSLSSLSVSTELTEKEPLTVKVVVTNLESTSLYMDYSTPAKPVLRVYVEHKYLQKIADGAVVYGVKEEHIGYYVLGRVRKFGKGLVASSVFTVVTLDQTIRDTGFTDRRSGLVFTPLLQSLRDLFRAHSEKHAAGTSHVAALKNLTSKFKMMLMMPVPQAVIKEFHSICDYTEAVYRLQVMQANFSTTAEHNPFLPGVITKLTSEVVHTNVINVESVVDMPESLAQPYPLKDGYRLKINNAFVPLTEDNWFVDKPIVAERENVVDGLAKTGRNTHVWCKLAANTRYANSDYNLYWAMKRVIGARDGEQAFQLSQLKLTIVLINTFPHLLHYAAMMGVRTYKVRKPFEQIEFWDTGEVYGIRKYKAMPEVPLFKYQEIIEFMQEYAPVIEFYNLWVGRMRPTMCEYLMDVKDHAVTQVKMAAYTLFSYCTPALLVRQQWAEEPHIKKLERVRIVQRTVVNPDFIHRATVACVKDEIAKPGKFPRVFMSYGDAVVTGPHLPYIAKKHMNGWHYMTIGSIEVCVIAYTQPKTSELEKVFNELVRAMNATKNYLCAVFYSDDSCYAGSIDGIQFGYNVDISSCDSSNGVPIFYLVGVMLHNIDSELAQEIVYQCTKPITIPLTSGRKIQVETAGVFEGSGTVATTVANNIASAGIAICVAIKLDQMLIQSRQDVETAIVAGAALMGHKVTVATVEVEGVLQPSKFQFLKYSPMEATHTLTGDIKMIPTRNFGTIIKSFGQLSEPMQARQLNMTASAFRCLTYAEKFDKFLGGVVKGYCNEPLSPLISALRARFTDRNIDLPEKVVVVESDEDYSLWQVNFDSLRNRYGDLDYTEMTQILLDLKFGDIVVDHTLETFMVVDYDSKYTRENAIDYSAF